MLPAKCLTISITKRIRLKIVSCLHLNSENSKTVRELWDVTLYVALNHVAINLSSRNDSFHRACRNDNSIQLHNNIFLNFGVLGKDYSEVHSGLRVPDAGTHTLHLPSCLTDTSLALPVGCSCCSWFFDDHGLMDNWFILMLSMLQVASRLCYWRTKKLVADGFMQVPTWIGSWTKKEMATCTAQISFLRVHIDSR